MAGLGQRLLGAGLAGLGSGIVQQAAAARQEALMRLQKKWADERDAAARKHDVSMFDRRRDAGVADRDAAADLTREGWTRTDDRAEAAADLTREGWTRADERAGRSLIPALNDAGQSVFTPQSEAAGMLTPQQPRSGGDPKLHKLAESLEGEITWGVFVPEVGGLVPVGIVDKQGQIIEDATAGQGDDGPSWFSRMLSTLGFGSDSSGADPSGPSGASQMGMVRTAKDGSRWRQDPLTGDWIEVSPAPGR